MNALNFPDNQNEPEIVLFGGHVQHPEYIEPEITTVWLIMTPHGPKKSMPTIGRPEYVGSDEKITLGKEVNLREESFGGVAYSNGVIFGLNMPAYDILRKLSDGSLRAGELPSEFLKELTTYKLVERI